MVSVYRGGVLLNLHQDDLLVGDSIMLTEGMEIPADCLLVESSEMTCDESAMTGESEPVKKEIYSICR